MVAAVNATRKHALERLGSFLPTAADYANHRNFDDGPESRSGVSGLSPWIRTRLVTEEEVCRAVIARHGTGAPAKFLQEVAWRTYWKGWLEMRPQVWADFRRELGSMTPDEACRNAMAGRTGIGCFDAWCRELMETGYLHNHARMWFASIWIFTLRLPWQLGAGFFLDHLLDGDPASNTLSWRWVGGLHTPGKHYLARAENIRRFTRGRFDPTGQLDEHARPLPPEPIPTAAPVAFPDSPPPAARTGHLLIPDDLSPIPPEHPTRPAAIAGWMPDDPPAPAGPSGRVRRFQSEALDDALARSGGERLHGDPSAAVRAWAHREKLDAIVMTRPTAGPWRDLLESLDPGLPVHHHVCDWDRRLWPHATAGYFRFRESLPALFNKMQPT